MGKVYDTYEGEIFIYFMLGMGKIKNFSRNARVVQLARTSPFQGEGRGFESRLSLI